MPRSKTSSDYRSNRNKRTDALLEWAVQHGEVEEAERLRKLLRELTERI